MIEEKEIKEIINKDNLDERSMCEVIKAYIFHTKNEDIGEYNLPTGKPIIFNLQMSNDVFLCRHMYSFAKDYFLEKYKNEEN